MTMGPKKNAVPTSKRTWVPHLCSSTTGRRRGWARGCARVCVTKCLAMAGSFEAGQVNDRRIPDRPQTEQDEPGLGPDGALQPWNPGQAHCVEHVVDRAEAGV